MFLISVFMNTIPNANRRHLEQRSKLLLTSITIGSLAQHPRVTWGEPDGTLHVLGSGLQGGSFPCRSPRFLQVKNLRVSVWEDSSYRASLPCLLKEEKPLLPGAYSLSQGREGKGLSSYLLESKFVWRRKKREASCSWNVTWVPGCTPTLKCKHTPGR